MAIFPYHIQHIQIDEDDLTLQWKDGSGLYLVFWWKCLAIGDLYLAKNARIKEDELRNRILKQIAPALEMYSAGKPAQTHNYAAAYLHNDFDTFRRGMNEIFAGFIPGMAPPTVDVSVVICTRNRSVQLKKCLESFLEQKCLPLEIIVVDNAPLDESTYEVARDAKMVKYIREPRPGLDVARNAGARAASASIVAYTDDDVEIHPWWTFQVNETFARSEASAMTGLVIASELQTQSQQIFEKYWSFNRGYTDRLFDPYYLIKHLEEGPPVWEIGAGANMAFRRSIFEKVGYFDERLDVGAAGCNGDSEMWYRILLKGGSINYNPRAVVFHEHRKEIRALQKQIFSYMRGFTAAALIQQGQNDNAGYKKHLMFKLPYHYLKLIARGFPAYNGRYKTVFNEIRGVISGVRYYQNNKRKSRY